MVQRIIGVPREIKPQENRVALVPSGAFALVQDGHRVLVEKGAGEGSGLLDAEYVEAGAEIVPDADSLFEQSDIIVKVKEPLEPEFARIRPEHVVFTYFHFAASRDLTEAMLDRGAACVAYETIEDNKGHLPLLTPMSEVAGRMSVLAGAQHLEKQHGGRGVLVTGVPGVDPAKIVILGGGVVGTNAAKVAAGLGANVQIFDIDLDRLRYLDDVMPKNVTTAFSNPFSIRKEVARADLVVGAVLVHGARAPMLVPRDYLADMSDGSVIVDVAVDQGGCVETTRPTTHAEPTYVIDGVVHYGVANMPGAVSRTSTFALTNATLPYLRVLARDGVNGFVRKSPRYARGLNAIGGKVYHEGVSSAFGMDLHPIEDLQHG
ncbi:MAG: alanine dehydrogenase [Planctomycetes bacterium]|nr:alanine dehydrogenase [Planctomycetota bacterium]